MGSEETSYVDDDDVFESAVNDEDYELELSSKDKLAEKEISPLAKRRMIEALLEERRLRRQIEDDFDFDD
ncbi:hypothetical protein V6U78_01560 [Marinospirillum sp. MEB164]|uniref:Uncharacterized protein n=1 Tax=Marinospirillum alkalitolerans TaxID=3123374 RepID=A0ABW8PU04_9GAMM